MAYMKNRFIFPIIVFTVLILACKSQSAEDKLAETLSKSKNFIEWQQAIADINKAIHFNK
jgi:hypothetical protein